MWLRNWTSSHFRPKTRPEVGRRPWLLNIQPKRNGWHEKLRKGAPCWNWMKLCRRGLWTESLLAVCLSPLSLAFALNGLCQSKGLKSWQPDSQQRSKTTQQMIHGTCHDFTSRVSKCIRCNKFIQLLHKNSPSVKCRVVNKVSSSYYKEHVKNILLFTWFCPTTKKNNNPQRLGPVVLSGEQSKVVRYCC